MKKEVLFVLLDEYADWEGAFLSTSLNFGVMPGSDKKYIPKTVAPTEKEVCSIGGFRTIPDYSFRNLPEDYAALILIGGSMEYSCRRIARPYRNKSLTARENRRRDL